MNRHRAYWSTMGVEPEGLTEAKDLKEKVENLISRYGFDAVVTQLRKHHESSRHECREESEVRNED